MPLYPPIHVNWAAVVTAVIASFVFGWLWYGPLFGTTWARLMGMPTDRKPEASAMMGSMALTLLGTVFTAYVLVYVSEIFHPSVWKIGADAPAWRYGFFGGFFVWLGFFVPMLLGVVAWQNKSWPLFGLNAAYHFLNLQIITWIVAFWR